MPGNSPLTVARPWRILTAFPILSACAGHPRISVLGLSKYSVAPSIAGSSNIRRRRNGPRQLGGTGKSARPALTDAREGRDCRGRSRSRSHEQERVEAESVAPLESSEGGGGDD